MFGLILNKFYIGSTCIGLLNHLKWHKDWCSGSSTLHKSQCGFVGGKELYRIFLVPIHMSTSPALLYLERTTNSKSRGGNSMCTRVVTLCLYFLTG